MENPYQSSTTGNSKQLRHAERLHRNVLEIYMKYRGADMPFSGLLLMYFKRWLFIVLVMIGVVILIAATGGESEGLPEILIGMLLGVVLRDIATCRLTSRLWPFTRELLDWDVVQSRFEEIAS